MPGKKSFIEVLGEKRLLEYNAISSAVNIMLAEELPLNVRVLKYVIKNVPGRLATSAEKEAALKAVSKNQEELQPWKFQNC